jgi:hypothetical protein
MIRYSSGIVCVNDEKTEEKKEESARKGAKNF